MLGKRREIHIDDMPYPQKHDLDALVDELPAAALARLLAKRGIFFFPAKDDKSALLWRYSFSYKWYLEAFRSPDPDEKGHSLIGYRAKIPDQEKLDNVIKGKINKKFKSIQHKPEIIAYEESKIVVDYTVHRTSYAACFAREDHRLIIELINQSDKTTEFRCHPAHSSDSIVAREIIKELLNLLLIDPDSIELEKLPPKDRTALFTQIFKNTSPWRLVTVCGVTLRSKETVKEVTQRDVQRLSQAILHGQDLDNDSLVKSLTADGAFHFSGATFWCHRLGPGGRNVHGGDFKVRISFKRNPKVLEINVITKRIITEEGSEGVDIVPLDVANELCDDYWKLTHKIFASLLDARNKESLKLSPVASAATPTSGAVPTTDTNAPSISSAQPSAATPAAGTAPTTASNAAPPSSSAQPSAATPAAGTAPTIATNAVPSGSSA